MHRGVSKQKMINILFTVIFICLFRLLQYHGMAVAFFAIAHL